MLVVSVLYNVHRPLENKRVLHNYRQQENFCAANSTRQVEEGLGGAQADNPRNGRENHAKIIWLERRIHFKHQRRHWAGSGYHHGPYRWW